MKTKGSAGIDTVLAGSLAVIVLLLVGGLWLQNAAISTPVASPLAKASGPAGTGTMHQTEASVSVAKVEPGATGTDASCQKYPEAQYVHTPSVCRDVVVADIPAGSMIKAVTPYVKEPGTADWKPCQPRGDGPFMSCGIEGFRFLSMNPAIASGPNGVTVTWTAMNSSTERSRDAQVLVDFE